MYEKHFNTKVSDTSQGHSRMTSLGKLILSMHMNNKEKRIETTEKRQQVLKAL
jgi:hypothetical protein